MNRTNAAGALVISVRCAWHALRSALVEKGECDAMLDHMFDTDSLGPERIRPLSRTEYERLVALGAFQDERVELLRGVLVTMSPQGVRHSTITQWLAEQLAFALGRSSWRVFSHSPYAASDESEPEPDISVVPRGNGPALSHPSMAALLIEVSDSSIAKDRRIKAPIYAAAGVPEYWIIDISSEVLAVEVHTQPTPDGYRNVDILRAGDVLRPVHLTGIEICVGDIPGKS